MAIFDIFNGDADGICSLIQLRNAFPKDSTLVTGVKRDIKLVGKNTYQDNDELTVLDISFDKNRDDVVHALVQGASVLYFDHHFAGEIPPNPLLEAHINTASDVCTALLVNGYLKGRYAEWALVGAFGDNLRQSAFALAKTLNLQAGQLDLLEKLGIYINYNGYGATLDDLHFEPGELYRKLVKFNSPLAFIDQDSTTFNRLAKAYDDDMTAAQSIRPDYETNSIAVFNFPNEAWARRVSGVYSNDLANANPDRAHAVLTLKSDNTYLVSVRAPLNNKVYADDLCRQFPTGGGRKAAAGINILPADQVEAFIKAFEAIYTK